MVQLSCKQPVVICSASLRIAIESFQAVTVAARSPSEGPMVFQEKAVSSLADPGDPGDHAAIGPVSNDTIDYNDDFEFRPYIALDILDEQHSIRSRCRPRAGSRMHAYTEAAQGRFYTRVGILLLSRSSKIMRIACIRSKDGLDISTYVMATEKD